MTVHLECTECGEPFRSAMLKIGLMKVARHCEEEHGISKDEFYEQLEEDIAAL